MAECLELIKEREMEEKEGIRSSRHIQSSVVDEESYLYSNPELTPEERDLRTIICMQLSDRIRPQDLEEFFSSVGKVRDVRLITDKKTHRSKGIRYVEFVDPESVPLAIGLSGQKLLGVPIIVQPSQAEKKKAQPSTTPANAQKPSEGPIRLYVGSRNFNIDEDMLRGIFELFGKFLNSDDAKKALDQLNGFELAGQPMKVGHVTDRNSENGQVGTGPHFEIDDMDMAGIDLGATGRLQLMAKLAEGTGFKIPQYAANAPNTLTHAEVTIGGNPHAALPLQAGPQSNVAGGPTRVTSTAPLIATPIDLLTIHAVNGKGEDADNKKPRTNPPEWEMWDNPTEEETLSTNLPLPDGSSVKFQGSTITKEKISLEKKPLLKGILRPQRFSSQPRLAQSENSRQYIKYGDSEIYLERMQRSRNYKEESKHEFQESTSQADDLTLGNTEGKKHTETTLSCVESNEINSKLKEICQKLRKMENNMEMLDGDLIVQRFAINDIKEVLQDLVLETCCLCSIL